MPRVRITRHLETIFPALAGGPLSLAGGSVAEVVDALEALAPGVRFYVCDELGRLRRHVNVFVDGEMIVDRRSLSDTLREDSEVFVAQALSGG